MWRRASTRLFLMRSLHAFEQNLERGDYRFCRGNELQVQYRGVQASTKQSKPSEDVSRSRNPTQGAENWQQSSTVRYQKIQTKEDGCTVYCSAVEHDSPFQGLFAAATLPIVKSLCYTAALRSYNTISLERVELKTNLHPSHLRASSHVKKNRELVGLLLSQSTTELWFTGKQTAASFTAFFFLASSFTRFFAHTWLERGGRMMPTSLFKRENLRKT